MIMEFFFNMIVFIGMISLFNLLRYLFKIRKIIKMHKDNPNIQGITIINGEVKIIERNPMAKEPVEPVKERVTDVICGQEIEKEKAYRVVKGEKEYFFCSWECREAFLDKERQEEGNR
ncbi:MAG: hypothetical protein H9872_02305 [Candidatus Cellulosilyticum pullistercoris]|uniref:TRASH domain-containing protein n=1 Tax=Candidatus Cellulosilyticum pullistercoris TaxID=2838521 RepID=A0A9E2KBI3_9FIRM|nr:hypothetical protein [Candidatus Cellulosilyticum pullistercoris]